MKLPSPNLQVSPIQLSLQQGLRLHVSALDRLNGEVILFGLFRRGTFILYSAVVLIFVPLIHRTIRRIVRRAVHQGWLL